MRRVALAAIVLGVGLAGSAGAQTYAPESAAELLNQAAFLDRETYAPGEGPVQWRSGELQLAGGGDRTAVDSVRITVGGALMAPGGLPLDLDRSEFDARAYDVTLIRSWPNAVSFGGRDFDFGLSPHAGVGVSNLGGQAEAGAMVQISPRTREERAVEQLKDMGVRDGLEFGDRGRWYLFAAASGRAVGLNMLRDDRGWDRAGWSTDPTGALIGDAHVGVGWRKGDVQTSFGVIHREVKGRHMVFGQHTREDTVAAFSFSIRPQQ